MAEVKIVGKMDNTIDHTFESANRVYDKSGLCPTIPTCGGGNIQPKIIEAFYANRPARVYEEVSPTIRAEREGLKVIDLYNETVKDDGICGTLTASGGLGWKNCGSFGVIEKSESDKMIVAMRGRNPENPTDRTPGIKTEQRLEMNKDGLVNTLTTVQKDNLVLEGVKNEDERKENLLQILRERIEKEAFCKWTIRGLFCILQTQILQQNVYAERLFGNWKTSTELEQFTHNGTIDKYFVATTDSVRDLWKVWETECSSYRRQFSEQQFIEFKSFMQKLPHEDTQTKIFMFCLWEASEGIWVLRKALSEIQEIWKPTSDKQGSWSYRIRKLTPREVWRLMGYTDTDFEKAAEVNSNTQLYRESGNAIVKQVMMAIFLQMGIKGLKKWEERSEEEKAELIRGSIYDKADFQ